MRGTRNDAGAEKPREISTIFRRAPEALVAKFGTKIAYQKAAFHLRMKGVQMRNFNNCRRGLLGGMEGRIDGDVMWEKR